MITFSFYITFFNLHLHYIFIQILYKYFYTTLYEILYVQYLHNPRSPQQFLPKLYETRENIHE